MSSRRKRQRSRTPDVPWAQLLSEGAEQNGAGDAGETASAGSNQKASRSNGAAAAKDPAAVKEAQKAEEANAWRALVVRLAALQGDAKTEAMLADKHPELTDLAMKLGAGAEKSTTLQLAKENCSKWFSRQLQGANRQGPVEKAAVCRKLAATLKERVLALQTTDAERLEDVLSRGKPDEEGPMICCTLGRALEGSRYHGLWISRERKGQYILGDTDEGSGLPTVDDNGARITPRVRVAVKVSGGKLVIDGFYQEGDKSLTPANVAIGPFLSVYFEGVDLKDAIGKWQVAEKKRAAGNAAKTQDAAIKAIQASLPPGWEVRESRSKKGTYYYANVAKGITQYEKPRA
eukprot:TRINITY_DN81217_c0_g1_i1.p2 TRINITY_DN81217_c0_g1~~TRINITY_DN81217_c0_g1_i1.p2  ORF type:complete len:347 (+),score=91.60 TRINITY_DN81217_c0_g1_i1:62-1102(+)